MYIDNPDLYHVQFCSRRAQNFHPRYPAVEPSDDVVRVCFEPLCQCDDPSLSAKAPTLNLSRSSFSVSFTQFSQSCSGTPKKSTLKLRECLSDLLILKFRLHTLCRGHINVVS